MTIRIVVKELNDKRVEVVGGRPTTVEEVRIVAACLGWTERAHDEWVITWGPGYYAEVNVDRNLCVAMVMTAQQIIDAYMNFSWARAETEVRSE